ncbi:DNA internalization-related competence protein ComEC/Rec2 [Heliobacterium gestii]|uniref:DNA internalization-related competence protein ComEC/Rec2 n=1 Tax=Heliomicrobium gestii TaxID=2699 RepID=A0A845LIQ3_HELGE|nr:DNA internalization-related competence protein ComEC/Rec2 [Heliomicrobium gestii]MBM7868019.1 competence protein ComEC [Heliomicrobium gestii]MZP44285.1 DNA internalization-related competence protein ComEC/Rec2 [Heliomicrobium gestii]
MKRPLVVFVCLYGFGIALGLFGHEIRTYPLSGETVQMGLALAVSGVAMLVWGDRHLFTRSTPHRPPALWQRSAFYSAIIVFGAAFTFLTAQPRSELYALLEQTVTLSGRVEQILSNDSPLVMDLRTIEGEQIRVRSQRAPSGTEIHPFEWVEVTGQLRLPAERRNPGDFDYRAYLWRQGVAVELYCRNSDAVGRLRSLLSENAGEIAVERNGDFSRTGIVEKIAGAAYSLRRQMEVFLEGRLPRDSAAIIKGILFGGQGDLSEEDRQVYRVTGVAHAFAVSGSNIAVIAGTVLTMLRGGRRWQAPLWPSIAVTSAAIVFYGFMTGFPASVQRALLMALGGLLAYGFQRNVDGPTLLASAALPILLVNPLMLADPGFQLSFAATWGILYLFPPLHQTVQPVGQRLAQTLEQRFATLGSALGKALTLLLDTLLVSLAAQLALSPLCLYYFNLFSVSGLLANIASGAIIALVTILGFLSFLLLPFWPAGALSFSLVSAVSVDLLNFFLRRLAEVPGAALTVATPSPLLMVAYYLAVIFFRESLAGHVRPKDAARVHDWTVRSAPFLIILFLGYRLLAPAELLVTFIDVGQGDGILIETPGGKRVLVDTPGPPLLAMGSAEDRSKKAFDPGEKIVAPFFHRKGITRLDLVVNTHADQDHIGGLPYLLSEFPVGQLALSPPPGAAPPAYLTLEEVATRQQVTVVKSPEPGVDISPDPAVRMIVLFPSPDSPPQTTNDSSLVLLVEYGQCRLLLTGDLEREGQAYLAAQYAGEFFPLTAGVVKIPHHGSRHNLEPSLMAALGELDLAVVSVGRNTFGHPAPEILQRWGEQCAEVLRTDTCGAVIATGDGEQWHWRTTRWEKPAYGSTNRTHKASLVMPPSVRLPKRGDTALSSGTEP